MSLIKENIKIFGQYTDKDDLDELVEFDNVADMFEFVCKKYPEFTAIVDNGQNYKYSDLDKNCGYIRSVLAEKGIQKGDFVGIYYSNSIELVETSLAVMSAGCVAVVLPYHLDDKTVYGCSLKFTLKAIFSKPEEEKVKFALQTNTNLEGIAYSTTLDEKADYVPITKTEGKDSAVILFTGGTTGKSKGALLSNKAVMAGTVHGCFGFGKFMAQRLFLVLPLSHVFGFIRNMMTSVYTHSTLYICRDTKNMFREIPIFNPTHMIMVPALAEMALNVSKLLGTGIFGNSLNTIIAGAAVVSPHLMKEYKKLGVTMLPGYGLTESANLVSGNPKSEEKPESVGLMYAGQEYKIVDGELWIKGENILTEYYNSPEENALAFEDGYFKTGDLVKFDDEGYMYIVGRIKDIIVLSNGENISPAELETRFCELDCIQDCLVYADEKNERLVLEAFPRGVVIKQLGITNPVEYCTNKLQQVNSQLQTYQRVSKIIIRDTDFERTPSMKIKRNKS